MGKYTIDDYADRWTSPIVSNLVLPKKTVKKSAKKKKGKNTAKKG